MVVSVLGVLRDSEQHGDGSGKLQYVSQYSYTILTL